MTELSTAAQAIVNAAIADDYGRPTSVLYRRLAAALRAVALNFRTEMKISVPNDFVRGVLAAANALEEIASELEAH